jgi:hypothetical protein
LEWEANLSPNEIQLLDAQGRMMFEDQEVKVIDSYRVPLTNLHSGYYFVIVKSHDGIYSLPLILK